MALQTHFNNFHNAIKLGYQDTDYAKAKKKDESITNEIKEAFAKEGYPVTEDFIQGSFSTHTAIKSLDGDFDIDRGIVIDSSTAPENPVDPKKVLLDVLEKRGFTNAKIKKPCVTADYASENLHIDFPIYKKSGSSMYLAVGKMGSDENNREWQPSDPEGLNNWIKSKSSYLGSPDDKLQQFSRSVRYIKRWRDVHFSEAVRKKVYSIGLTVMVKKSFKPSFDSEGKPNDAQALRDTVSAILNSSTYFTKTSDEKYRVSVSLPVSPYRDIFENSSLDTGTQLWNKLSKFIEKMDEVLKETSEKKQCTTLNWLLGEDFKIPDSDSDNSLTKKSYATSGSVGTSQGA